ncbi:hypothetical protein [Leptolyngbya sp. FACHB-16]|uniref:hypothetical protein n=2 Tax=Leptolyngbya TaxID=47251 RepID=UPI00168722BD|nr:hypothetical protein [Leptolyngbya sp. FACHB-16]MBD1912406.1 hypothetical protein [Leptolyngbya sp. FACHB-8]
MNDYHSDYLLPSEGGVLRFCKGCIMLGDREHSTANLPISNPVSTALRPNPFTTYRDPDTGRWVVVFPASSLGEKSLSHSLNLAR